MKGSDTQADALDACIDRLQRRGPALAVTDDVDPDTAHLAQVLHQFAQQAPRRPGFVQELERRLAEPLEPSVLAGAHRGTLQPPVMRSKPIHQTIGFQPRRGKSFSLKAMEGAAVVLLVLAATAGLALVMREVVAQRQATAPPPAPARLMVGFGKTDRTGTVPGQSIHVLDPDTLADLPNTSPLDIGPCGAPPVMDRQGRTAAVVANSGPSGPPTNMTNTSCPQVSALPLQLRLVDLTSWEWSRDIELEGAADRTLQLVWTPARPPILWNPDGSRLYVFTVIRTRDRVTGGRDPDEIRQMWIVDAAGADPPAPVPLDAAPWRADFAPSGHAIYVLGYQTRGPSGWGYFEPGSASLLVLDPNTGVTRARIPLPGVKMAAVPGMWLPWSGPGVGLSPNGRYYFVAHPDEPIVDVIDVFAPGYERLERSVLTEGSVNTGTSTLASLAVSPNGRQVYVHRWSGFPIQSSRLPTHVINVGTWTVRVFDSTAAYFRISPDGQWFYAFDPPRDPMPTGQMPDARNAAGAGLRVVDTSGRPAATLLEDQIPFAFAQAGANRLYVVRAGPDFDPQALALARQGQDAFDLIAYEIGSWRELARRSWHLPLFLDIPSGG